ncbi:MAG: isochorismate synthase [Acidimicrobiales bacterium]
MTTALKCVSVELPPAGSSATVELTNEHFFFRSQELSLHGIGRAKEFDVSNGVDSLDGLDDLTDSLSSIECDDAVGHPGSGPVAFASLSFNRSSRSTFVVPETTYVTDASGRRWVNVVSADPYDAVERVLKDSKSGDRANVGSTSTAASEIVSMTSHPSDREYCQNVKMALSQIAFSTLRKVVLARYLDVEFQNAPDVSDVLVRLSNLEPTCTTFHYPIESGSFLGATPELLVSRRSSSVHAHPLAGTVGVDGLAANDTDYVDTLNRSTKDQSEHSYVVTDIVDRLEPLCQELSLESAPSVVLLNSMAHLGTHIRGTLRHDDPSTPLPTVLDLVSLLHPTAAVAGIPRDAAISVIAQLETAPREHWAGPVGWVDRSGDGDWMVGIRSATIHGRHARVWAGAGVVPGSVPSRELQETQMKLFSVLEALSPGASRRSLNSW